MKNFIFSSLLLIAGLQTAAAQKGVPEGTGYFLPRTEVSLTLLVEKTTYTPGEFAMYAEKYLKIKDVKAHKETFHKIISHSISAVGERDTSKYYIAPTDAKHNIESVKLSENGTLLAINATPAEAETHEAFVPAPKEKPLNPRDFMKEEVFSAGSAAKMAELCALEIYDIRESRSLLSKGQADFMPKDGEQLRLMLKNLDTNEKALMQLFCGTTVKDTVETVITFVPTKPVSKQLLFRFSKCLGITDVDDLGGSPYYISVEDLHMTPQIRSINLAEKKPKSNVGIFVNTPGKIKLTLHNGEKEMSIYELYAAQFGRVEALNPNLFGKKFFTSLVLGPSTGYLESLTPKIID